MSKKKIKRPGKGENLFRFIDDYTAVDVEATGLDPQIEALIEIGAIKVRNGIEVERFSRLIKPDRPIPERITELTGISDETVADADDEETVLKAFLAFLGDDIILGQNVNCDINYLYDACKRHSVGPLTNNFVDTMKISQRLIPELPRHRLSDLTEFYEIEHINAHRAVNDCEVTHLVYRKMFSRKPKEFL